MLGDGLKALLLIAMVLLVIEAVRYGESTKVPIHLFFRSWKGFDAFKILGLTENGQKSQTEPCGMHRSLLSDACFQVTQDVVPHLGT